MNKIICTIALSIILMSVSFSQPWMQSINEVNEKSQGDVSFYEIQKAFNTYWKDKKVEKSKGYKQFRRWEYFMEPRVYPSGYIDNLAYQKAFWSKINNKSIDKSSPTWLNLGPSVTPYTIDTENKTGNGRINCIAFHPDNPNILYAGAPSGGFWKSEDNGVSWTTTTDQLSSIGVSDIVVDYTIPDNIYLATGDGDHGDTYGIGIVKSTDGGDTWQPTSLAHNAAEKIFFRKLLMDPDNHNIMITTSNQGIYKTTNGWSSYSLVESGNFKDLEFHPTNSSVIYATSYSISGNANIYRSVNGGEDFAISMEGIDESGEFNRIEIAVTPDEPNSVFALISDNFDDGFYALYKSVDQGVNWQIVYGDETEDMNLLGWSASGTDNGGQGWYDLSLAVSPTNADVILVGGVNLWKTIDGGENWMLSGFWQISKDYNYVHADQHILAYSPLNGKLYSGNDGGVYVSSNHGLGWTDISSGLEILQNYKIGVSQSENEMLLAGNQDNGTFVLKEGIWNEVYGGDGMECIIDPVDPDILYSSIYFGSIYKSVDGGLTFSPIKPTPDLSGAWITPYVMSSSYRKKLLVGYDQIYKTVDGGSSWEVISDFSGEDLKVIRIAPSNEQYVYVTDWNNIWKTNNEGEQWTDIGVGLPQLSITDIAISDTDPNKIWISVSGYDENNKVFYSSDGGANWQNYSQGLPNVPANCLLYQNKSNKQIYLGTDLGIYHRNAAMDSWEEFNGNLPNVIVTELEIQEDSRTMYAGTFGRGIWNLAMPDTFSIHSNAIKANITEACVNADVMFSLQSNIEDFDSIRWDFGADATLTDETDDDTMYVSYGNPGLKDVSITTYIDGIANNETYVEFINVNEDIEFEVFPKQFFNCSEVSGEIFITGNYALSFDPPEIATQTSENTALIDLHDDGIIAITASHGTCTDSYDLEIIGTPDDICEAKVINFGENGPFSNLCGTPQENEPVPPEGYSTSGGCYTQTGWCQGEARIDNSVWFKFVVPENVSEISIETEGFDNQIAVYKANSCEDLLDGLYTLLAANDDFYGKYDYSATISNLSGFEIGDTLWLQVDGSYGGTTGTFTIQLNDYIIVGIEDEALTQEESNIKLFPNPTDGNFTIQIDNLKDEKVNIEVLDVSGKQIFSREYKNVYAPFVSELNLGIAQKGMYLVRIITNKEATIRKVLVQ